MTIDFGPEFFFGSATSSFQIEGRSKGYAVRLRMPMPESS